MQICERVELVPRLGTLHGSSKGGSAIALRTTLEYQEYPRQGSNSLEITEENRTVFKGGANSGAIGDHDGLTELANLWPSLSEAKRAKILRIARG